MGDRSMVGSKTETACLRILLDVGDETNGEEGEAGFELGGEEGEAGGEEGEDAEKKLEEEKEELEKEAEEASEEAEYTSTDREVACMLLGSVSCVSTTLFGELG